MGSVTASRYFSALFHRRALGGEPGRVGHRAQPARSARRQRDSTQLGEAFNRPVHRLGLDIVLDMKADEAQRTRPVQAGPPHIYGTQKWRSEPSSHRRSAAPHLDATWTSEIPARNGGSSRGDYRTKKCEDRARWRWAPVQSLPGGSIQLRCPAQCAGRVVTNLKTHSKLVLVARSAPETEVVAGTLKLRVRPEGLTAVPVEALDYWQRILVANQRMEEELQQTRPGRERKRHAESQTAELSNLFCRSRGLGSAPNRDAAL